MTRRSVMIFTGTRADFGLLKPTIREFLNHKEVDLQLIVTGSHLSEAFGMTLKEIEEDGIPVTEKIPILKDSITDSMSLALKEFSDCIKRRKPTMILVLGDRYEAFCACTAALMLNVPIAHLHGGELTFGALDDALRHSMTKMSWWHFTSTEEYRNRVIKLGEDPARVFNVGATAIDSMNFPEMTHAELENYLGCKLVEPVILATMHPETINPGNAEEQLTILWKALKEFKPGTLVFTKANADEEGMRINSLLEKFISSGEIPNSKLVSSLGQKRYFNLMKKSSVVVGNSSSGVIEAPMMGIPSINIGTRQEGRVRSPSVIDVDFNEVNLVKAFSQAVSGNFRSSLSSGTHPFGTPGVSERIVETLINTKIPKTLIKGFYE